MPAFNDLSLEIQSSTVSVMSTRSSANRNFHGTPVWNSCKSASSTRMKRTRLAPSPDAQQLPRQTPHCTVLTIDPHTTPYIGVLDDPHSPFLDPRLLKALHRTFLGTRLKAFSRPTNAKHSGLFYPTLTYCLEQGLMERLPLLASTSA